MTVTLKSLQKDCPNFEWKDVSNEAFRVYVFPNGEGIRIDNPIGIAFKEGSTGHRIVDAGGRGFYIPGNWIALYWEGHTKGKPQYNW